MITEQARRKYEREQDKAFKCRLTVFLTTAVFWCFVLWAVVGG